LLTELKGIGPAKAKILEALGLRTIEQALYHLPARIDDRSLSASIRTLKVGETATIQAVAILIAGMQQCLGTWIAHEKAGEHAA
jgi:ATP-dependent DNA helicase RecG